MDLITETVPMMGTKIDISIEKTENSAEILEKSIHLLEYYKDKFSANDANSSLMKINSNAGIIPIQVDDELFELISIGKEHSIAKNSCLNIAIGPLVQLWRIGFKDVKFPTEVEIKTALSLTNPNNIILNENDKTVFLTEKDMKIDLGALAKGYIADKIIAFLKDNNISFGLINLGGNVLTFGDAKHHNNFDDFWKIGIQKPKESRGNHLFSVGIKDCSVVTSGIYERVFEYKSEKYHHIFDRNTGYPIKNDIASLTIISTKSIDGEIWTTRLFGLEVDEALETINTLDGIEGCIITKEDRLYLSNNFLNYIK